MSITVRRSNGQTFEVVGGARRLNVQLEVFGKATVTDIETGDSFDVKVVDGHIVALDAGRSPIGSPLSQSPTVSELVVEGFSDGGFRAEHALAVAMANASPMLVEVCKKSAAFLRGLPKTPETEVLIRELNEAVFLASTPVSRNAS